MKFVQLCNGGPCKQGRNCPTPLACRINAEPDDDGIGCVQGIMVALAATAGLVLLGLLIAWVAS